MTRAQPKQITITRAEGPTKLCGIEQKSISYSDANIILRLNAATAPEHGGYDKHDFKIVFEDGSEYYGRYDLMHWRKDPCDLARNVRENLQWIANDERATGLYGQALVDQARQMLEKLEVGQ